jgi:hypothetical protein
MRTATMCPVVALVFLRRGGGVPEVSSAFLFVIPILRAPGPPRVVWQVPVVMCQLGVPSIDSAAAMWRPHAGGLVFSRSAHCVLRFSGSQGPIWMLCAMAKTGKPPWSVWVSLCQCCFKRCTPPAVFGVRTREGAGGKAQNWTSPPSPPPFPH